MCFSDYVHEKANSNSSENGARLTSSPSHGFVIIIPYLSSSTCLGI